MNEKMNFYIDRARALEAFKKYTANYDSFNVSINIKISHTYRVAEIAERIAGSISKANIDFSWLLGLLHDIGRFEQVTRYGTFKDALSVDHAELGADILFHDNLFGMFVSHADMKPDDYQKMKTMAETAIRLHNKLRIPEDMETQTEMYTKILRDADKIDIFRVLTEPPYDEYYQTDRLKGLPVRNEVMQCVREHRCVPRVESSIPANELETLIAQCCMAFELEYPESLAVITEQGYLMRLLSKGCEQLSVIKNEIMKALKQQ